MMIQRLLAMQNDIRIDITRNKKRAVSMGSNHIPDRPKATWYIATNGTNDVGRACLWQPRNRKGTLRLSHCFVRPEYRGNGIGRRLVMRRYQDAHDKSLNKLDTFAYNPDLFQEIGFEKVKKYSETVHLEKELNGKIYSEQNVLEAAQDRIRFIFSEFENVYLSISGGKDSSVGMQLCSEVAREKGEKYDVLFIDLEAQYEKTIEQVKQLLENNQDVIGTVYWVCLPFSLRNAVSQLQPKWTCWNPDKKDLWVRDIPDNEHVIDQSNNPFGFFRRDMEFEEFIDKFAVWYDQKHNGKTATGVFIRSDESFNRFRSLINEDKIKHGERHWTTQLRINDEYHDGIFNFYPIYDWDVEDVWGYVSKFDKPYNRVYDYFYKNGMPLSKQRICQPYGDEQRQALDQYRAIEPETWEELLNRVSGVNFGNIYARSSLLGHLDSEKPDHLSWQEYTVFLLETLEIYCPELREHYTDKITTFLEWYEDAEYTDKGWHEQMGLDDIPDEHPDDKPKSGYPSWERIAWALERNDFWMGRLGFAPTKGARKKLSMLREKYGEKLLDPSCTDDVNLKRWSNGNS